MQLMSNEKETSFHSGPQSKMEFLQQVFFLLHVEQSSRKETISTFSNFGNSFASFWTLNDDCKN
jgi:hypothetical protein